MPNHTLREALDAYTNSPDGLENCPIASDEASEEVRALQVLAETVREFVDANPNFEQALALLHQVKTNAASQVIDAPFDLPAGYVLVTAQHGQQPGYQCGIAPDGSVSS